MDKDIINLNNSFHIGSKRFLPLVFLVIIVILLIPLYVNVFKDYPVNEILYLALEDEQMALNQTTVFRDLITYYNNDNIYGYFKITTTFPNSIKFKVIDSDGKDITSNISLANDISKHSIVNFAKSNKNLTLQYTNSSASNFLTRIEINYQN